MQLRKWRLARGLTFRKAAKFFGLRSGGGLCDIEQGHKFPSLKSAALISAGTQRQVKWGDHFIAWGKAHPDKVLEIAVAVRSAAVMRHHRAKLTKEKGRNHGRKGNRGRGRRNKKAR